jgi:hypothetical protein
VATLEPDRQRSLLEQVPPDASMDEATITVWNGERFVAWRKWLATAPIIREERPPDTLSAIQAKATCVVGECNGTKVWLVRDGGWWLIYVGSRKTASRQRDFATPHLRHAILTAEQWYGASGGGWRAEKERDGARETVDLPPQNPTDEEGASKRGDDDLGLGRQ